MTKTCSKVGGGGGLAALLFSALVLQLLVLTILKDRCDKQERGWGREEIMEDKEILN
jgi:hypothetical protein